MKKRSKRRIRNNYIIRKYIALILVIVFAITGIKLAPETDAEKAGQNASGNEEADKAVLDGVIYQYPIELGYSIDYNYNGNNAGVDYHKKVYDTVAENIDTKKEEPADANKEKDDNVSTSVTIPVEVTEDYKKYTATGLKYKGSTAFIGEIRIEPVKENGFDKVKIGDTGDYKDYVVIGDDAVSGSVDLYLSNGFLSVVETFTYTRDTTSPVMSIDDGKFNKLHSSFGDIFCTNSGQIDLKMSDGEETEGLGIDKACVMYADKIGYIVNNYDAPKYMLPDDFYGKLTCNCIDKAGNASDLVSQYLLVESTVPNIQISEGDEFEAPDSVKVEITDDGKIISGISAESIECSVNGSKYEPKDVKEVSSCKLADNLLVSTDTTFSISFKKDGTYDIEIAASDNCGNTARLKYYISVVNGKVVIS